MNAVAASLHLDGRPGAARDVALMLGALHGRHAGQSSCWDGGLVALGHRERGRGPSDEDERPSASAAEDIAVTADIRLDNRAELGESLRLRREDELSDVELLLAGYRAWGRSFVERLVGDFAIVLWDGARRTLFCARDQAGVGQLYYHRGRDGAFRVASTLRSVIALPEIPRELDEQRVAEHICPSFEDNQRTFYRGVMRLPPAHLLRVDRHGLRIERYWALDPQREIRLASDADYAEAFRALFLEAVRCRLRGSRRIGTTLSGGLDSSSVTCAARSLRVGGEPLPCFSAIFERRPECDERGYISSVLRGGDLQPHAVPADELTPFSDWDAVLEAEDEPPSGPNVYLPWAIYRAASEQGVGVLLEGFDGDTAVSHGLWRLADLAASARLLTLTLEVACLCWRLRRAPWSVLRRYVAAPLAPSWSRPIWQHLRGSVGQPGACHELLQPELLRRCDLDGETRRSESSRPRCDSHARWHHHTQLVSVVRDRIFEASARSSAAFGVEPRYPFEDRRLLELALALPAEQKMRWGWTRSIVRRALGDILPGAVLRRSSKADFSAKFVDGMRLAEAERLGRLFLGPATRLLEPYVDSGRLRRLYQRCMVSTGLDDYVLLFRVTSLLTWLQRSETEPR